MSSLFSFFPISGPSFLFLFLSALVVDTILDETKILFFGSEKKQGKIFKVEKRPAAPFLSRRKGAAPL